MERRITVLRDEHVREVMNGSVEWIARGWVNGWVGRWILDGLVGGLMEPK